MGDVRIIRTVADMHRAADEIRHAGHKIGLVPTMGYLHEGHLSLIRLAREHSDWVVVSIFVNPTQFGPQEDLASYPQDFDRDVSLIRESGGHAVYAPTAGDMYPAGYATYVEVTRLAEHLCGASRPGHFRGVATVVTKLLAAVKPHVAVFGQKDAQQAAVIRRMVRDLDLDVEVLVGATVREHDGLAMSSRNAYLRPEERCEACVLYQALHEAKVMVEKGERHAPIVLGRMRELIGSMPHAEIDYVAAVDADNLQPLEMLMGEVLFAVAVRFGNARLIDNLTVGVDDDRPEAR